MKAALVGRIERLEALRPLKLRATHRVIQGLGETKKAAIAEYEQTSGRKVGPDDFLILRVIVAPPPGVWS